MHKAVLIVGLLTYDSGKTTVAEGIASEAIKRGFDVGVSKPVSSYNIWYQHEFFRESIKLGVLVGEDVVRLHKAARSREAIEVEGPIVGALAPPDPEALDWRISLYANVSSSLINQMIIIRVTRCLTTSNYETLHFIVRDNIEKCVESLKPFVNEFLKTINYNYGVIDVSRLASILENEAPSYADECLNQVCKEHELTIIESYNDVASPTRNSLEKSSVVVAVAPGRAAIYQGEVYRKAAEVLGEAIEPWKLNTRRIVSILRPKATVKINVKGSEESWRWREALLDEILKEIER